jgi:hypothetical protein
VSPDIRLVLDTSAVLAYTATSVGLGETIVEIVDEGAQFAVPVLCLVQAAQRVDPKLAEGLDLLVAHEQCIVLPMLAEDWRPLAELTTLLGQCDLATSLLEAIDRDAYVITGVPSAYLPAGGEDLPVIGL